MKNRDKYKSKKVTEYSQTKAATIKNKSKKSAIKPEIIRENIDLNKNWI